jgi:hypothetical protein
MADQPLVDFLIIGAMKASTTSLLATLDTHPGVVASAVKEAQFFVDEVGGRRGRDWYRSLFAHGSPGQLRGEASPQYTFFPFYDGVPERMHAAVPDVRLVYLVRDPVDRLVSHWRHALARGLETRPLQMAALHDARLQMPSRYWLQLERYFAHFEESQVLVVDSGALAQDAPAQLRRICAHIGADPEQAPTELARLNVTEDRGRPTVTARAVRSTELGRKVEGRLRAAAPAPMARAWERVSTAPNPRVVPDAALEARLRALFAADVDRLRDHLGDEAPAWTRCWREEDQP